MVFEKLKYFFSCALIAACSTAYAQDVKKSDDGFTQLFDGKTLTGWKANEKAECFKVEEGSIVVNGPRSHLFYVGDEKPFVNFELVAEIKTNPNSNSGLYFHTQFQPEGWPKHGFECQVNQTYKDPIKTGSLYQVKNNLEPPVKDDEWFTLSIRVEGKHIVTKVNDKVVADYTEPEGQKPGKDFTRVVDKGTFALQAHDPGSTVRYRSIKVKRLD